MNFHVGTAYRLRGGCSPVISHADYTPYSLYLKGVNVAQRLILCAYEDEDAMWIKAEDLEEDNDVQKPS